MFDAARRGHASFAELHPIVVDPPQIRKFASELGRAISEGDARTTRQLLQTARDRELERIARAWQQPGLISGATV